MTASNIERFDRIVALVLGDLYTSFPCPVRLLASSYIENALAHDDDIGAEVMTESGEFFNHTMNWLDQAGYLQMQSIHTLSGTARGVVLTAKGLEALRAVPASLEGQASLGERLIEQTKINSGEGIKALMGEVIGLAVRGVAGM